MKIYSMASPGSGRTSLSERNPRDLLKQENLTLAGGARGPQVNNAGVASYSRAFRAVRMKLPSPRPCHWRSMIVAVLRATARRRKMFAGCLWETAQNFVAGRARF